MGNFATMQSMKRFIVFCLCSLIASILVLWSALYFPTTQKWVKEQLERYASAHFGYDVTVGSVTGCPPFLFTFNDIQVVDQKNGHKVASIATLRAVPAWVDIVLGRIAFFYLELDAPSLQNSKANENSEPLSLASVLPNRKISIYSFSCTHLKVTPDAKELYEAKGSLFWNSKSQYLTASIKAGFSGEQPNRSSVALELNVSKKEIAAKIQGKLYHIETFFPEVPLEQLDIDADLKSCHTDVLEKIWGAPVATPKNASEPRLRGKFSTFLVGSQKLQKINPEFYSLSFSSSLELASESLFSFELSPIKIHKTTGKSFAITSNLFGHIQRIQEGKGYQIALKAKTLSAFDLQLTDAALFATCKRQNNLWSGTFASKGVLQDRLALLVETAWATDGKKIASLDNAKVTLGQNKIQGSLNFFFSPFLMKGKIEGRVEELTPLAQLFKKNISGNATFAAAFDITRKSAQELKPMQTMQLSLNCTNLHAPTFGFEKADVEIEGSGEIENPQLKISLTTQKGVWKHIEVESARLLTTIDLTGEKISCPFAFQGTGKVDKGPFIIDIAGQASENYLYTKDLFFMLDKSEARLQKPFSFEMKNDALLLSPLDIAWENGGRLLCDATLSDTEFQGSIKAEALPLEILHFFFPKSFVSGAVSMEGRFSGTKKEPQLHVNLKTDSMVVGTHKQDFLLPLEVLVDVAIDKQQAQAQAAIKTRDDKKPLVLELKLPIYFQENGSLVFAREEEIAGSLKGLCEVSPFLAPFLDEDELIEGTIQFDLGVKGTAAKPDLTGGFSWKHGRFDILKTGSLFSHICAFGIAKGDCLIIESLVASDEKNGAVFIKGKIELKPELDFPFALQIDASRMEVVKYDFAQVTVTGKAELQGNFQKAKLSGKLLADKALLNLTSDFSSDVPTVDFIYINHPDPELFKAKTSFVLALDLDVTLPNTGTISGRGLQSNWTGDLKISGTTDAALVYGQIASTTGTFSFANKEFKFTEGSIDCAGDIFSQSRLNILAAADLNNIRAQISLRGSLDKPRLSLQSVPLLPEKEILSRILFNKSITEVSPIQGLQLAQILMSMNGKASKFNVIEKFKNILGIDHIDVSRNESADPSEQNDAVAVQVGKHLSESVFLKLSKDVANAVNRVAIEATLHKNVSVQAEVGDDQEGQMSLMWKYDY